MKSTFSFINGIINGKLLLLYILLSCLNDNALGFVRSRIHHERILIPTTKKSSDFETTTSSTVLFSTPPRKVSIQERQRNRRKQELLSRNGPYFRKVGLDKIEFGSTAKLNTKLSLTKPNYDLICDWLIENERELASSIWDPSKMKDMGNNVYRMQVMQLQFVTIGLQPSVDMRMKTTVQNAKTKSSDQTIKVPTFSLESVDFDPNITLMPGVGITAESLGIKIEVVGELKPTMDGKGVSGIITFQTTGKLPLPLQFVPEPALKVAANTINETIVNFAIRNFQKGAKQQYQNFVKNKRKQQQQQ